MKQKIKEIIKKNLPKKKNNNKFTQNPNIAFNNNFNKTLSEINSFFIQNPNIAFNNNFNKTLSEINSFFIVDEVLKITKCDCCDEKDEYIFKDDKSTTRISRPCGGCGEHQTIAGALLKSKEWKKWYEYASKNMLFDVDETLTVDAMSDKHWNSFMGFLADEVLRVVAERINKERQNKYGNNDFWNAGYEQGLQKARDICNGNADKSEALSTLSPNKENN